MIDFTDMKMQKVKGDRKLYLIVLARHLFGRELFESRARGFKTSAVNIDIIRSECDGTGVGAVVV